MDKAFMIIGMVTVMWWITGVVIFSFMEVYVAKGTPVTTKLATVFHAGFAIPYLVLRCGGRLPLGGAIMSDDPSEEEQEAFDQWREAKQDKCDCPACVARRMEGQ